MKRLRTSVATLRMVASDGIYTAVAYEMLRGPMRGRETAEGFSTCARAKVYRTQKVIRTGALLPRCTLELLLF